MLFININSGYSFRGCPQGEYTLFEPFNKMILVPYCTECNFGTYTEEKSRGCLACPVGYTSDITKGIGYRATCKYCDPDYKFISDKDYRGNGLDIYCEKCPDGYLATNLRYSKNEDCTIKKKECNADMFYNPSSDKCILCSDRLNGSIGRIAGSPPDFSQCLCPIDTIRSKAGDIYSCLNATFLYKNNGPIDYGFDKYAFEFTNDYITYRVNICPPLDEEYHKKVDCACPLGYKLVEYRCRKCLDIAAYDEYEDIKCFTCGTHSRNSLDNKECIFDPEADIAFINGSDSCIKGKYRTFNGPIKCIDCPIFYTTLKYGATGKHQCTELDYKTIKPLIYIGLILTMVFILFYISYKKAFREFKAISTREADSFELQEFKETEKI